MKIRIPLVIMDALRAFMYFLAVKMVKSSSERAFYLVRDEISGVMP